MHFSQIRIRVHLTPLSGDLLYLLICHTPVFAVPTASDPKVDYQQFFRKVAVAHDLNSSIFAVLNSYVPPAPAPIMTFTPPNNDYAIDYIRTCVVICSRVCVAY